MLAKLLFRPLGDLLRRVRRRARSATGPSTRTWERRYGTEAPDRDDRAGDLGARCSARRRCGARSSAVSAAAFDRAAAKGFRHVTGFWPGEEEPPPAKRLEPKRLTRAGGPMDTPAVRLMERLGLSDDELCAVLAVDPIAVITGELDHRPELGILLALTAEAAERVGPESCGAGAHRGPRRPPARPPARARLPGVRERDRDASPSRGVRDRRLLRTAGSRRRRPRRPSRR